MSIMAHEELSVSDARKLAKYYGNTLRKSHEVAYSENELQEIRDCLSYCRYVILKKGRKKVNNDNNS